MWIRSTSDLFQEAFHLLNEYLICSMGLTVINVVPFTLMNAMMFAFCFCYTSYFEIMITKNEYTRNNSKMTEPLLYTSHIYTCRTLLLLIRSEDPLDRRLL